MFQFCQLFLNLDFLITLFRISLFIACFISTSAKRSDINNFILDHQTDVFFIVATQLKGVGDEAKIADLTPSGYATRSFCRANRGGGFVLIARSHVLQNIAFRTFFSLNIIRSNCFKQHYRWKEGVSAFSVSTDLHLIATINLLIPVCCTTVRISGILQFHYTLQVVC